MTKLYASKDNEFVAWYPNNLTEAAAKRVWYPQRAAYYVHIPFCTAICDYCAFAIEKLKESNTDKYLEALKLEIRRYKDTGRLENYRFDCGHFGGGTPSAISADDLMEIKRLIDGNFTVSENAEITVEVNPISFTLDKGQNYRDNGVNRISFGLQSFNDTTLKTIGRPHGAGDVDRTLDVIHSVGWDNFSLDLIYGVPGQTLADLERDLEMAVNTNAAHVSCFRLEIVPFTVLKLKESAGLLPQRLSRELLDEMDDLVRTVLTNADYRCYGAFNYARPGYESVHNDIAFTDGEYIGFGNSSYSFINDHVYCNYAELSRYTDAVANGEDPIAYATKVNPYELMCRFFVLGLKFHRVSRNAFASRFGVEPESVFSEQLTKLVDGGMLTIVGEWFKLTDDGVKYVNNVVKEFYSDANRGVSQHLQFAPTITRNQVEYYSRIAQREQQGPLATSASAGGGNE